MSVTEKRMPTALVGVLFAAALVVVTLAGRPAVAQPPNPGHGWAEVEDHGVDGGSGDYWLGPTVDKALELRVFGTRALRLEPNGGGMPNVIGGHSDNDVIDGAVGATIAGGGEAGVPNRVSDQSGTVGGGIGNLAGDADGDPSTAEFATVCGGGANTASGPNCFVGGGSSNVATGFFWDTDHWVGHATVGGGENNTASEAMSTVAGGRNNEATGWAAAVGGGVVNKAEASWCTVGGGEQNEIYDHYGTIGGGYENKAGLDDDNPGGKEYATVGGGRTNTASGHGSTVGGGGINTASGFYATVGGGQHNTAAGLESTVGGGALNDVSAVADWGTIGGGWSNDVTGVYGTVGGGSGNTASGNATVPGGATNTAAGSWSFAAGRLATANNQGCFVWGDSSLTGVNCNTNDRFMVQADGGLEFYSSSDLSTWAKLNAGSNAWTYSSSRDIKENFTPVDGQDVLASVAAMPITTWNMKAQDNSIRHMGPVAQDFYAAFGLGDDELGIGSSDIDGVALAAVQGLYELSQEQDARIEALESDNASLNERLDDLEARVTALEGGTAVVREAPAEAGSESPASSVMPTGWFLLAGLFVVGGLVVVQRRLAGGR